MKAEASPSLDWPEPAVRADTDATTAWFGVSAFVSLCAGFLTPFTVSLVGEMPVGELVLLAVVGWAGLCLLVHRAPPGHLFRQRYLYVLLACELVALGAYMVSDFYRHSLPRDMARGWARMILLGFDLVAMAYLLSRSRRNFVWFLAGQLSGELLNAVVFGALFGDDWKFGYGIPATYAVLLLASFAGPFTVMMAAAGMGALHFALDFRSVGALCFLVAGAAGLHLLSPRLRLWALPCAGIVTALLAAVLFTHMRSGDDMEHRASRSDVDRSSMLQAAMEAFQDSPLLGNGSWFSRTNVYENFVQIRADRAKEAGIGGFAGPNEEPEAVALHSQILVTLAEGGIFGATFFFAYGAGLLWALWNQIMVVAWRSDLPLRLFQLVLASWHLVMSPFSGAHRVYIALAAGVVLLVRAEHNAREEAA